MVSKVERERAALEAAERDLAERKTRLAELAVAVKPKVAIEALEKMVPSGSGKPS